MEKRTIIGIYLTELYKTLDLASGQSLTRAEFGRKFGLDQPTMHRYMTGRVEANDEFLNRLAYDLGNKDGPDMTVFERLGFTPEEIDLRRIIILWTHRSRRAQLACLSMLLNQE